MSDFSDDYRLFGVVFLTFSAALFVTGWITHDRVLEFSGFMLMAGTFLPWPADTYVLYVSQYLSPVNIAVIGGAVNAVAVLAEKRFIKKVIESGKLGKFMVFFEGLQATHTVRKRMFLSLLVTSFSFLPFEPFRFVAVTSDYDSIKYFTVTFLGRGFRYYLIAAVGEKATQLNWLGTLITITLILFLAAAYKTYRKSRK